LNPLLGYSPNLAGKESHRASAFAWVWISVDAHRDLIASDVRLLSTLSSSKANYGQNADKLNYEAPLTSLVWNHLYRFDWP